MTDRRILLAGALTIGAVGVVAVIGPLLSPYDAAQLNAGQALEPPTANHLMGTDQLGRDVFTRVSEGARRSLLIGLGVAALSGLIGVAVGAAGGWFGRAADTSTSVVTDITLAFPGLLLAAALVVALGTGTLTVVLALSAVGWPLVARSVRAAVRALRQRGFVEASIGDGASPWRTLRRHVLPHAASLIAALTVLSVARAVITESALAFLAIGVDPDTPSWGAMIADGRRFLITEPHVVLFPCLAVVATVAALFVLADVLRRDALTER